VAIISTSVKKVQSWAKAISTSSERSQRSRSIHGTSVVASHCRLIASSVNEATL
jgi:hypothetical protein